VQDHHVRVVDHAGLGGTAEVGDRLGKEDLALEAGEAGVDLEEDHPGVAEHQRGGLHVFERASDLGPVRRGVVLHLLAGGEVVAARRQLRLVADSMAPAESGQGLVGKRGALRRELFMHPSQVPAEASMQIEDLLAIGLGGLRPLERRHLCLAAADHLAHRLARDAQSLGDLATAAALLL
jgi:hypothetical protein